jgi:hypothetical protein
MTDLDLAVTFPSRGVIRLRSRSLFGDADNPNYRRFLERVFQAEEISNVTITGGNTPQAEMGFGIMASVVTNNVAALAALANGVLPLRKVAQIEAERRHRLEMSQTTYGIERNALPAPPAAVDRRGNPRRHPRRVRAS